MKGLFAGLLLLILFGCKEGEKELPDPDVVYFQVAELEEVHGDSYILALKDEAAIAEARAIIDGTLSPKIVLASITKDPHMNYYLNKDLEGNQTWSWHIAEFMGFVDLTIEIYDGWPTYVEENYIKWVENTKDHAGRGVIGFWNYTVVREVNLEELQ